jgi:uncharacterized protein (DUF983 family)
MKAQLPTSVSWTVRLLRLVVAWSGMTAMLTYVYRDELVRTWARGNPVAREVLAARGLDGLRESSIDTPGYVALATVSFVVFAALLGVLVVFFRAGHHWARVAITATVVLVGFSTVAGLGRDLPALFVLLSAVSLLVSVTLLVALWSRQTSVYLGSFTAAHSMDPR